MAQNARWASLQVRVDGAGREVPLDGQGRTLRVAPDPRDTPLEFTLTPRERDVAKLAQLHVERARRTANTRDALQSMAVAGEGA